MAVAALSFGVFALASYLGADDVLDLYERGTPLLKAILSPMVIGGLYLTVKWIVDGHLSLSGSARSVSGTGDRGVAAQALQATHRR